MGLFSKRDGRWRECFAIFTKTLADGSLGHGLLMRRWDAGAWQYRRMTAAETEEYLQSTAW